MGLFVAVGRRPGIRIAPIMFAACALLSMSACSSGNPDALANPNTEQADVDLNDAMNAIAEAPANAVDPAPVQTAAATDPTPSKSPSPNASTETRKPSVAETVDATAVPEMDQEEPSDEPSEEPTNSY